METCSSYKDQSSKEDLEKIGYDPSTPVDSDSSSNDEGAAFLSHQMHLKRAPYRRAGYFRFLSPPILAIAGSLIIASLLAMNIATLVILYRQSRHASGHAHHQDLLTMHSEGESLSPEGLRIAPNGKLLECGEKAKDAEANGCIFDIMSFEWTPPACYDEATLLDTVDPESILAPNVAGVFPWYRWANFTEPLEQKAEVLSAYPYVWTNQDWHKGHCLYMWRLLVKAENQVLNGEKEVYVPAGATNHAHIAHCNLLISDKVDGSIIPLEAFRTVTSCVRLDRPDWTAEVGAKANFGG